MPFSTVYMVPEIAQVLATVDQHKFMYCYSYNVYLTRANGCTKINGNTSSSKITESMNLGRGQNLEEKNRSSVDVGAVTCREKKNRSTET